ncbi:reverse transcriptase domain-containing protein, partial [Tanacetum coccineum]
ILKEKYIQEKEVEAIVEEEGPIWITPIIAYLKDGTIPDDRKEASKLRIKAKQYELLEGVLYRQSFLKTLLRTAVHGGQGYAIGILLADHASGCPRYDTRIRTRKGQVFDSRHGLFHKMDRGKSRGNNHCDNPFKDWCEKFNITQRFASVKHLQSNGLVERANRSLGEGIKARLGKGNKN